MTVADLGEFGLIAAITAHLPQGPRTLVGIGDDAAVVAAPDRRVVATMDLLVEGRHFRREWSGPADIGAKAAARNLADVAAMGASPVALLVGLAVPGDLPAQWPADFMSGMAAECAATGAVIVGGDVSSADRVMVAVTALGDLAGRPPVRRSGAHPGDVVAVVGTLGHSAAGLALLEAGRDGPADLLAAHRRPHPPYDAGIEAATHGATAMIDVSDGLVADLGHVALASGVLIDVESARLVPSASLIRAATTLGRPGALDWMLAGGEDHALAASFPPDVELSPRWSVIGSVRQGRGVLVDGQAFHGVAGWDHFR